MESVSPEISEYRERLLSLMANPSLLPQLAPITIEIQQAILRSDTSLTSLAKLIARDPDLSDALLHYAPSVMLHSHMPPETLFDVVRLLGMVQVERISMVFMIRNLFKPQTRNHKRLFLEVWDRAILKASTCGFIAKALGKVTPDEAILASLLTEVGTFMVVKSFEDATEIPSREQFVALCREFSKPLSNLLLKSWGVDEHYIELVKKIGDWQVNHNQKYGLIDAVNLGLFHALKAKMTTNRLPPLQSLAAWQKLSTPENVVSDTGELELVIMRRNEIREISNSLY